MWMTIESKIIEFKFAFLLFLVCCTKCTKQTLHKSVQLLNQHRHGIGQLMFTTQSSERYECWKFTADRRRAIQWYITDAYVEYWIRVIFLNHRTLWKLFEMPSLYFCIDTGITIFQQRLRLGIFGRIREFESASS